MRNAGDAEQVRRAGKEERFTRDEELNDLREVLSSERGRRFLWARLAKLGVNRSVFITSSEIYYRSGRQDAGHELLADILAADSALYLQMQGEAIARDRNTTEPPSTPADE